MKLKKNDTVLILSGKDKAKTAKVQRTFPNEGKVLLEGINVKKVHKKKKKEGDKGQVVEIAFPIPAGKVKIICPKCKKASRLGIKIVDNKKVRICKKCNQEI